MREVVSTDKTSLSSSLSSVEVDELSADKFHRKKADKFHQDHRKKELLRITNENQAILKRIQGAQPMYNHVQWEESHK